MPYTFRGVQPFVEAAAAAAEVAPADVSPLRRLWHVQQVQDALGQLPRLDPAAKAEAAGHVRRTLTAFRSAVDGCAAAVAEAFAACGLAPPADELAALRARVAELEAELAAIAAAPEPGPAAPDASPAAEGPTPGPLETNEPTDAE